MKQYINNDSCQFFAFNIWDVESAKAIIDAAAEKSKPVILQTSMKAFELMNKKCMRNFITDYSAQFGIPVYLHLDHCKKDDFFIQAIENGWNSVMLDASDRSLKENIELTNKICEYAHKNNVLVESEIGHVAGVEDGIGTTQGGIASIENIEQFIQETQIDFLAVAIGTAHGLYHGKPELHYELLEETARISDMPLVIHGGTGLEDAVFRKLLSYKNVKKINISTDVKQACLKGIQKSQEENLMHSQGFDPLKVTTNIHQSIMQMAMHYLELQEGILHE